MTGKALPKELDLQIWLLVQTYLEGKSDDRVRWACLQLEKAFAKRGKLMPRETIRRHYKAFERRMRTYTGGGRDFREKIIATIRVAKDYRATQGRQIDPLSLFFRETELAYMFSPTSPPRLTKAIELAIWRLRAACQNAEMKIYFEKNGRGHAQEHG